MSRPVRLLTTAGWLCHLLVFPVVVTCQFRTAPLVPGEPPAPTTSACLMALSASVATRPDFRPAAAQTSQPFEPRLPPGVIREPLPASGTPVEIDATGPGEKAGPVYHLRDNVQISYRDYRLAADDITYNEDTGEAVATGHVRLTGGPRDENIEAARATYNINSETGTFTDVHATLGMAARGGHVLLSTPNPLAFTGVVVQRTGPDQFIARNATVTTCDPLAPAWTFASARVVINVGHEAGLHNSTFRLHRIPAFYLPYVRRPVESLGRQSGFLLPTMGQSTTKGTTFGDSFYWAINRSMDATIGGEYFSRRGWAQRGEFRIRPEPNSFFDLVYSGVLDRGIQVGGQTQKQGGEEVRATGDDPGLPLGFRGVADVDYLSSFLYRLAFSENFSQAVNSEVKSVGFLSRDLSGFSFNILGSRYQNFESTTSGDLVTILHAPTVESQATARQLGGSRVFWSYSAAAEGVSRSEPGFSTSGLVGRFDFSPGAALPLIARGWSLQPELSLRDTYYTEQLQPNGALGVLVNNPVNRRALESAFELRPPAVSRVFVRSLAGWRIKHSVEPRAVYRYVTGINNFPNVIRFDARDLLSDTNEIEYAVVNRIYGKRLRASGNCAARSGAVQPGINAQGILSAAAVPAGDQNSVFNPGQAGSAPACESQGSVRELVRWELAQKAFFDPDFGGAVVNGRRNVLTTTADLTGIAFLTEPRHFSPIISRLRVQTSASTDVQWNLDYDTKKGRISGSTVFATWRLGEFFLSGNQTFFHAPGEIFATSPLPITPEFNQFRVLLGYGHLDKHGLTAAGSIGYDKVFNTLQYGTLQTSYNWSCIGLSFEYRRFSLNTALGAVRVENQFRFALNLANIGTFGNLRRQERLF
ncbi:MAG: LPS-assembly protein LptD [Acidobacteria bacterium]|nr:LPS-assembly protein LptD [Acidobacteriota bacterium]